MIEVISRLLLNAAVENSTAIELLTTSFAVSRIGRCKSLALLPTYAAEAVEQLVLGTGGSRLHLLLELDIKGRVKHDNSRLENNEVNRARDRKIQGVRDSAAVGCTFAYGLNGA